MDAVQHSMITEHLNQSRVGKMYSLETVKLLMELTFLNCRNLATAMLLVSMFILCIFIVTTSNE